MGDAAQAWTGGRGVDVVIEVGGPARSIRRSRRQIEPVIDRTFGFSEARAAYEHLASGQHFRKVVIHVG